METDSMIAQLRRAADIWQRNNPTVYTGEIRYCDALRDAANKIEDLNKLSEFTSKQVVDLSIQLKEAKERIKELTEQISILESNMEE